MSDNLARDDDDYTEGVTVDDLKELRRQRDAARDLARNADQARQRAERERDEARGAAGNETVARFAAEEAAIDQQIAASENEAAALESHIASLNAEGSFGEAAKQHRAMARVEANLAMLTQRKAAIALHRSHEEQQVQARSQQAQQPRRSPRQQQWVNEHPLFDQPGPEGERFRQKVQGAHFLALSNGAVEDSDEYYDAVNEMVGGDGAARPRAQRAAQPRIDDYEDPQPQRRAPAMPVTRSAVGGAANMSNGPVRLSPDEREAADIAYSDVPIDDYVDRQGVQHPGRYKLYHHHKQQERRAGRLP